MLKYSVLIFLKKIYKMQHLESSGTPVLYIEMSWAYRMTKRHINTVNPTIPEFVPKLQL